MAELTKERLKALSNRENVGAICSDEISAMARQLLAGLEQEPVAWQWLYRDKRHVTNDPARAKFVAEDGDVNVQPLYAAPQLPQPAVPDIATVETTYPDVQTNWQDAKMYAEGWNACRATMLQAGNSPVIPDAWIPVSERMPPNKPGSYEYIVFESLNNRAHHDYWNVPDGSCDDFPPFWNHYGKYVTHWMLLPAAQQQEVHFKTTSDERLMKTPDITDEAVKVIGSFNDNGFCHKHLDTPLLKHPYMQLSVYPPRPATYCPKCEPHVAEWEERDKQLRKSKGV